MDTKVEHINSAPSVERSSESKKKRGWLIAIGAGSIVAAIATAGSFVLGSKSEADKTPGSDPNITPSSSADAPSTAPDSIDYTTNTITIKSPAITPSTEESVISTPETSQSEFTEAPIDINSGSFDAEKIKSTMEMPASVYDTPEKYAQGLQSRLDTWAMAGATQEAATFYFTEDYTSDEFFKREGVRFSSPDDFVKYAGEKFAKQYSAPIIDALFDESQTSANAKKYVETYTEYAAGNVSAFLLTDGNEFTKSNMMPEDREPYDQDVILSPENGKSEYEYSGDKDDFTITVSLKTVDNSDLNRGEKYAAPLVEHPITFVVTNNNGLLKIVDTE